MDPETTQALLGETGLAGVQWLLAGMAPLTALRETLGALLPHPAQLGDFRLHRAKYKPGRHLTAYYEVSVRDANGGEMTRQVEAVWQPEGAPSPHGPPLAQELMEAEAQRLGEVEPFLHLAAVEPDWGFWLRVSPLDPKFPQLARLSDPANVRSLLAQAHGPDTSPPAERYTVNVVRYRPGQRHLLRYDPDGAKGPGSVFAKIYNNDKGERLFAVVTALSDWLAAQGAQLTTVRPLAYLPDETTVLYPWVDGAPLSQLLQTPDATSDAVIGRAGAALRALHAIPLDLVELKPHSLAKELKGVASAAEHIHKLLPATGAQIRAILERAAALHERLPQEPPGFAYGDFKSDHLWVTPGPLTLIDFDTCYLFDPAIDIGKFLADLRWWYDSYGLPTVEAAQERFLDAYCPAPERMPRARLYEVLVLVKTVARRVRLFDENWDERTARLIDLADELLQSLEQSAGVAA
jgi:aminoglycoside phosphotransferase (APT) family kinase protein